jgi:hypothetical protein
MVDYLMMAVLAIIGALIGASFGITYEREIWCRSEFTELVKYEACREKGIEFIREKK